MLKLISMSMSKLIAGIEVINQDKFRSGLIFGDRPCLHCYFFPIFGQTQFSFSALNPEPRQTKSHSTKYLHSICFELGVDATIQDDEQLCFFPFILTIRFGCK